MEECGKNVYTIFLTPSKNEVFHPVIHTQETNGMPYSLLPLMPFFEAKAIHIDAGSASF